MNKRKNNFVLDQAREKQRFSIRKLSIGAASVLLGTFLFWGGTSTAQAATETPNSGETTAVTNGTNETNSSSESSSDSTKTSSSDSLQNIVPSSNNDNGSGTTEKNATVSGNNDSEEESVKKDSSKLNDTGNSGKSNSNVDQNEEKASSDINESASKEATDLEGANEKYSKVKLSKLAEDVTVMPDKALESSKVSSKMTSTVTVTKINENGTDTNETISSSPDNPYDMTAGEGIVNLHVKLDNLSANDKEIYLHFSNIGNNFPLDVASNNLQPGQSISNDNWTIENISGNADTTIYAKWNSSTQTPTDLSFNLPIQGNQNVVTKNTTVSVDYKVGDGQNQNVFNATIKPYVDKVSSDEILKGFVINNGYGSNPTTVGSEYGYGNITNDEYQDLLNHYDNNTEEVNKMRVAQYGFYFNYNTYLGENAPQALKDAIFNIVFKGNQTLIPGSIKVFEVPENLALDPQTGERHGINDKLPDGNGTYYSEITKNDNYSSAFSNYLKGQIDKNATPDFDYFKDGNEISVNQSGQEFEVPDVTDASQKAYFIQLDTVLTEPKGDEELSHTWMQYGVGKRTPTNVYPFVDVSLSGNGTNEKLDITSVPELNKTIKRTVNYYEEGTTTKLKASDEVAYTFQRDAYDTYTDQEGQAHYGKLNSDGTFTEFKGNAIPEMTATKSVNGGAATLLGSVDNNEFDSVVEHSIVNGEGSTYPEGDWIQTSAERVGENGPAIANNGLDVQEYKIVPEGEGAFTNGADQEYNLYYTREVPDQPTEPTSPTTPGDSTPDNPTPPEEPTTPPVYPVTPSDSTPPENPTSPESPTTPPVKPVTPSNEPEESKTPTKSTDEIISPVHSQSITNNFKKVANKTKVVEKANISTLQNISSSKQTKVHVSAKNEVSKNNELPQTGAKDNNLGILGLAIAAVAGLFGLGSIKKRKDN